MKRYKVILMLAGAGACLGLSAALAVNAAAPAGPAPGADPAPASGSGIEQQLAAAQKVLSSKRETSPEERAKAAEKSDRKAGAGKSFEARKVVLTFSQGVSEKEARAAVEDSPVVEDGRICSESFGEPVVMVQAKVAPGYTVKEAETVLEADPRVSGAQPNYYYTLADAEDGAGATAPKSAKTAKAGKVKVKTTDVDDRYRSQQKFLRQVRAYDAWDYAKTDNKVTVAVIDTGIDLDHPDLKANIVDPYNVVGNARSDETESQPGKDSAEDVLGHGTHCAGLAAGATNNGIGIASVSYNANVMPIRVFYYSDAAQNYTCTSSDLALAYNYLMENAEKDNVRVASMSLGGEAGYDDSEEGREAKRQDDLCIAAVQKAHDDYGIATVAAAGNENSDVANWPSDSEPCIGVIALNDSGTGRNTQFSNYGPTKKISAPGTDIFSTCWSGDGEADQGYSDDETGYYGTKSGTSMATPIVAGGLALLFSADPDLTADEAEEVLCQTATDLGTPGRDDQTGYGAMNVEKMVRSVTSADVAEIDGLPTVAVAGSPLELAGTAVAAQTGETSGQAAQPRSSEVSYEMLDPGQTGASLSGSTLLASEPGTVAIRATIAEGGRFCSDYTQDFQVRVVRGDLSSYGSIQGLEASYTYTGAAIEPTVSVVADGAALAAGTDYTLSYSANVDAGTATVTATGAGACSGSCSASFAIAPRSLDGATVEKVADQRFTGTAVEPRPTVTVDGRELALGTDYTLSYADNVKVGTATVTASGTGNYTGSCGRSFRIVRSSIAGAALSLEGSWTYTGSAIEPVPAVTMDGKALVAGTDFVTTYMDNVDAGTAEVLVLGTGSYGGSLSAAFEIAPADIAGASVAAVPDQTATGGALEPALTVSFGSRGLAAGTDYNVTYQDNTAVGTATATLQGTGNFQGTKSVSFQIVAPQSEAPDSSGSAQSAGTAGTGASAGAAGTGASAGTAGTGASGASPKAGAKATRGGVVYKLARSKTGAYSATVSKAKSKKIKKAVIPAKVKIAGKSYKVAAISKKAFYKCKKLKTITVKSKTIKKVGAKAFAKIGGKVKVRVPAKKAKSYRKLFVKAGLSKKATFKKI